MIVVDTNILAARFITSPRTRWAIRLGEKDSIWIAPLLWRYELQNVLASLIQAKHLTEEQCLEIWRRTSHAMLGNEIDSAPEKVIELVARHRITAYDGQFIAVAMELSTLCVTEDEELRVKFPGVAVSMESFLEASGADRLHEAQGDYRAHGKGPRRKLLGKRLPL